MDSIGVYMHAIWISGHSVNQVMFYHHRRVSRSNLVNSQDTHLKFQYVTRNSIQNLL